MASENNKIQVEVEAIFNSKELTSAAAMQQFEESGQKAAQAFQSGMAQIQKTDGYGLLSGGDVNPLGFVEEYFKDLSGSVKSFVQDVGALYKEFSNVETLQYQKERAMRRASSISSYTQADVENANIVKTSAQSFVKDFKSYLNDPNIRKELEKSVGDLTSDLSKSAKGMMGKGLAYTDKNIVDYFISANTSAGSSFSKLQRNLTKQILAKAPQMSSDKAMEDAAKIATDYSRLLLQTNVPTYLRRDPMDKAGIKYDQQTTHAYTNFNNSLPQSFKNINHAISNEQATTSPRDMQALSSVQIQQLGKRLLSDGRLAHAFEQVGLAQINNGSINLRQGITNRDLNLAAGQVYKELTNSAIGMPMYGLRTVKDLNNPENWNKVAHKNNKDYQAYRDAAYYLEPVHTIDIKTLM